MMRKSSVCYEPKTSEHSLSASIRMGKRPGFTLLEVILASVIAVILLGALYTAMDLTLYRMDASRRKAQTNDLSRSVIQRMLIDLTASLGPLQPKSGGGVASVPPATTTTTDTGATTSSGSSGSSSSSGSTSSSSSSTTSSSGSTASTSTSSDGTSGSIEGDTESPDAAALYAADVPFQGGVFGTSTDLTLFVSRVPQVLTDPNAAMSASLLPADLRRVTYYLGLNGGLCRQERPWVTASGVRDSAEPDYTTESVDMIAPEVVDVMFEYFDGSAWATEWDGSVVSTDGKTPMGPPRAIRMILLMQSKGRGGSMNQTTVEHVFPIRAAVGGYQAPVDDITMTEDTTTTGGM